MRAPVEISCPYDALLAPTRNCAGGSSTIRAKTAAGGYRRLMRPERPRARRYPFITSIDLTDVQSEEHASEQTKNLSLFGCHVHARKPLPAGTKVRIRIRHAGTTFIALGKVAYAEENGEMGIAFTKIESNHQLVLEKWIAELRDTREAVRR